MKSTTTIPPFQYSNIPINSITIELWLQPGPEEISHMGHIFSILDEQGSETFFVGQWRFHLILGKGIHGKKTYREIGIRDALKKGDKRFVTITSGVDGTNIYVDGILMKSSPRFHLFSMNEKPSGKILLGNSPTGNEYWTGNLLGLAIYDRPLAGEEVAQHFPQHFHDPKKSGEAGSVSLHLFDEHSGTLAHDSVGNHHLIIPSRFEVLQKTILVPPWEDFRFNRSYLMDILTNILGVIPLGFFLSAYLWMRKPLANFQLLLMSVIMGGCMSLFIELVQVYLPTRNSQFLDVITNILGTVVGVSLFLKTRTSIGRKCKW
jgi:VanZ family protein